MRWSPYALLVVATACGRTEPVDYPPGSPFFHFDDRDAGAEGPDGGPPPGCTLRGAETHTLPPMPRRPIDVLFVIDNSCSMGDDQQRLASNFEAFIGTFRSNQVDFQIGVITTDMDDADQSGKLVTPFIDAQTPSLDVAFSDMVNRGSSGSSVEQALGATWAALHPPLLTMGNNAGFVRDGADLAVVYFGDEDDQSSVSISGLADHLRTLKGSSNITAVGILGLDDSWLCFPNLVSGWRIAEFTRQFGERGALAICRADYADLLRSIAGRIVHGQCVVGLNGPIDAHHRVRVSVNGAPATYTEFPPDSTFPDGSIEVAPCPEAGGTVRISYDDCP